MTTSEKDKRFDAADYLESLDDVAAFLELARRVGMSRDGLYKALSADGNPTWSTILKITNALGLRFELHPQAS
jgi:DNA-binding phage protein